MTQETLRYIAETLTSAGINYEFGQWSGEIVYPYFVGEYTESEPLTEDGLLQSTFTLNGFSRTTWLALEQAKATVERVFSNHVKLLTSGNGVCIFYAGALIVPENDPELKRMQINLTIKEWRAK